MRCFYWALGLGLFACNGDASEQEDKDRDGYSVVEDCDDNNPLAHPNGDEVCDGVDNNCNGDIDEGMVNTYYVDNDADGYGDPDNSVTGCLPEDGQVQNAQDCNDGDFDIHPLAEEICDSIDNDCNGLEDDDASDALVWYRDVDGDGYAGDEETTAACTQPDGYYDAATDCLDSDPLVYPGAPERCDGLDTDCADGVAESMIPGDYDTIQQGLDAAPDAAWLCVSEGLYEESLEFNGQRSLVVESVAGPEGTVIDGKNAGYAVRMSDTDARLSGFSITGANLTAVYLSRGTPILEDLTIRDNRCVTSCLASALISISSDALISGVLVEGNELDLTIERAYSTMYFNGGSPTLMDVELRNNLVRSTGSEVLSGGMFFEKTEATVIRAKFVGNTVDAGDQVYAGSLLSSNSLNDYSNLAFFDNTIESQDAILGGSIASIGQQEDSVFTNLLIAGNSIVGAATVVSGAISSTPPPGDAPTRAAAISISNATITGVEVEAAMISASAFAGVYGPASIDNSTWSYNQLNAAGTISSCGISYVGTELVYMHNNSWDHTCTSELGSIYGQDYFELDHLSGTLTVVHPTSNGNITIPPAFVDTSSANAEDWDLSLDVGSGLINSGRPSILDPDGTTSDIGAFGGPGSETWSAP